MKVKAKKLLLLVLVCLIGALLFLSYNNEEKVSYIDFVELVKEQKIESVEIDSKIIYFSIKDENTENNSILKGLTTKKYSVINPNNPELIEKLLLSGVEVNYASSLSDTFSFIFDIVFYIIFIGIILFVFKKFISPNSFKIVRNTGVKFSDIVGMDDLKKAMVQISDMMKRPEFYKKRGIRVPKGILMEGAPGNGKTLFARALANEAGVNFIATKATDFESMFMSIGPAKVKMLFRKARKNSPCIVFIDEFDGIGTKRNYNGSGIETENTRIVTALLNELDGFTVNNGVLVVAATNSRKALDEALIRPGRFDANYVVPYPDYKTRVLLVQKYMQGKKFDASASVEKLATIFDGFSCAQIESVINKASMIATEENREIATLSDVNLALSVYK